METLTLPPRTIAVTGNLSYRNFLLNESKPLAWTLVEVCDEFGDLLFDIDGNPGILFTNINGNFTFGPIEAPGGLWVKLQAYTRTEEVKLLRTYGSDSYSESSVAEFIEEGENRTITWEVSIEPRWTILSSHTGLTKGWIYIRNQTDHSVKNATARYPFWGGPHYDTETREIHLPEDIINPIWKYPDTILHEYSHYAMHYAYGWYFPENTTNYSIQEHSNVNVSWTEGWAFFFPLAVKNDPNYDGYVAGKQNFETPYWCSANWDDGDDVVGRVTGALWDIFDSTNDTYAPYDNKTYDTFHDGFTYIWNIMNTTPCDTFHDFWQAWNTSGYPKQPALLAIFQNSIDYRGTGDVNADGKVDGRDVYEIQIRYGFWKGHPEFAQWADLDYDDRIDGRDLFLVNRNFGKDYDC